MYMYYKLAVHVKQCSTTILIIFALFVKAIQDNQRCTHGAREGISRPDCYADWLLARCSRVHHVHVTSSSCSELQLAAVVSAVDLVHLSVSQR